MQQHNDQLFCKKWDSRAVCQRMTTVIV